MSYYGATVMKDKWEKAVKAKDGNKCKKCKAKKNLIVHCKVPAYSRNRKKFDVGNGVTLCRNCSNKTLDVVGIRNQTNRTVIMYG